MQRPAQARSSHAAGEAAILHLRNATITAPEFDKSALQHRGAVYGEDGLLVESALRKPDTLWRPGDPAQFPPGHLASETIGNGIYLGHFFPVFGHFILETLTSLAYARNDDRLLIFHPWECASAERLLNRPHVVACLDALGIGTERIRVVTATTLVTDLLVPNRGDMMGGAPVEETLAVYSRIAEYAQSHVLDSGFRKLYLSRRFYSKRRRLLDEEAVEELFRRAGFHILYPEQLPLLEQISLVSRAEVVAGPRGSNLHLTGFMRPGSTVIEITKNPMRPMRGINELLGISTATFSAGTVERFEGRPAMRPDLDGLGHFLRDALYSQ